MVALYSALVGALALIAAAFVTGLFEYRRQGKQRELEFQQRELEFKVGLANQRTQQYAGYLTAFANLQRWHHIAYAEACAPQGTSVSDKYEQAVVEYLRTYHTLFPVASDVVLKAAMELHELGFSSASNLIEEANNKELRELYATLVVEMRKDMFEYTEVREDLVLSSIPWSLLIGADTVHSRRPTDEKEGEGASAS